MTQRPCIVGIDEAGRGALAGPVVAAAVVLHDPALEGIVGDSKDLRADQRDDIFATLQRGRASIALAYVDHNVIDAINILQATMQAMHQAYCNLNINADAVLVDGNKRPPIDHPKVRTIVKGDRKVPAIGAASIVAKVSRDRWMTDLATRYPHYAFGQHKGYATAKHFKAILDHGPCPVHRKSFTLYRQTALF